MHVLDAWIADDSVPSCANAIAEIDVFADLETCVETVDGLEDPAPDRHVPAAEPEDVLLAASPAAQKAVRTLHPRPIRRREAQRPSHGNSVEPEVVNGC